MKYIFAIAALGLISTQAKRLSFYNQDDNEVSNLAERLGHQSVENDDAIADAMEEQVAIKEHKKDEERKNAKYMKKLHRNDNWREEMKLQAEKKKHEDEEWKLNLNK